jgi:hypothetical protein
MKKFITLAIALAGGLQAFGQGTIVFQNSSSSAISNRLTNARAAAGQVFNVALYYLRDTGQASVTTGDFDAGIGSGATSIISSNRTGLQGAGIYNGGTRTAGPQPWGGTGWFQVRAWETAYGDSWDAAINNTTPIGGRLALVGTSNVMKITGLGNPAGSPPTSAATLINGGIQWFWVEPVPEPSVIGLGILGIGALMLLRRRK